MLGSNALTMVKTIEETLGDVRISELRLEVGGAVSPDTPIAEVYEILDRQRRNAVVICEGDSVVGIFTQRDILYRTALEALRPRDADRRADDARSRSP